MYPATTGGDHKARLCVLCTWPDFPGYGFNLHVERGGGGTAAAQYVGKVDAESPAEAAGLREGDRIVAVNGVDVAADETHRDVVTRIRSDSGRVQLLVVDPAADAYFADRAVRVSASMSESNVQRVVCPTTNVYAAAAVATSSSHLADGKRYFAFLFWSVTCVTSSTSLTAFRRRLKSELFLRCFGQDCV